MKIFTKSKVFKTTVMALSMAALVGTFGCGKVKTQDEKVLKIEQTGDGNTKDTLMSIATLLELYGHPEFGDAKSNKALNADEIKNILKKLKSSIEAAIHVDNLPIDQIIDTVVKVFPSLVKGITPQDIYNGVISNFPLVTWYQNKTDITFDELKDKISSQFPDASNVAREGLFNTLIRFDDKNLAGNADGLMNVKEMAAPILLMSSISKLTLSKEDLFKNLEGIPLEKMTKRAIQSKLDQQLYGRYMTTSFKDLSDIDMHLELMQLSLKFYHATLASSVLGIQGELFPKFLVKAIKSVTGIEEVTVTNKLIKFYDSKLMMGDGNNIINSLELFNLCTDVELAHQLHEKNPYTLYENPEVIGSLVSAFPKVSKSLFSTVNGKPSKIWEDLENFDNSDRTGNEDKAVSDTELAVAISGFRLVDLVYEIYDVDQDGKITRDEAEPLFQMVGAKNNCIRNGFFADIRFSSVLGNPGVLFKLGLSCAFSFVTKSKLTPVEFYTRLVNAIPVILENLKENKELNKETNQKDK